LPTRYPSTSLSYGPTVTTRATCFASAPATYSSDITVNGVRGSTFTFSSATQVTIEFSWNWGGVSWCPGCIIQLYMGIAGRDAKGTCMLTSGSAMSTFALSYQTSLSSPGCYQIFNTVQMGYYCGYYGAVTSGTTIGAIWVGPV
jgi:hypothetical protein